jgi:negative regulator of flagellin synthesis FlgM
MLPGRLLEAVRAMPEVRRDLVERLKLEIAAGTYETPEKIDRLAERLLGELEETGED